MPRRLSACSYVSFASAGTRGLAYIGLMDAFEDHLEGCEGVSYDAWRASLVGAAGTSAGSCAALLLLLGLNREARREIFDDLSDVSVVVRCPDVSLLMTRFGIENGYAFKELVQRMLTRGGLSTESTLGDLKRLLRQDLVCVCTDLQTGHALLLSADTVPEMRVCDAVYASCCVPFMFTPVQLPSGRLVADGCLASSQPEVFDETRTLFVMLQHPADAGPVGSWADFLHSIVRCATVAQSHRIERLAAQGCHVLMLAAPDSPAFDVHQSQETAMQLHRSGYTSTLNALTDGALLAGIMHAVQTYLILAPPAYLQASPSEAPPDDASASAPCQATS